MDDFNQQLEACAGRVHGELEAHLSAQVRAGEQDWPQRLRAAMQHGALNGGKRLRPFLVLQSAALFGEVGELAMRTACALECIHCYSLVHDDLPAMDDDDLRRGKPTVHIAYDEATAILTGDALLTFAFDLISQHAPGSDPKIQLKLVSALARAAGAGGMVGGQMYDLMADGAATGEHQIRLLQSMKTGALIRFACEAGGLMASANGAEQRALKTYGEKIGLAFQLADDLLDLTSSSDQLGKATGKDADQGKGTLVGVLGEEACRSLLAQMVEEAIASLEVFGDRASHLAETAKFVAHRDM